jgi:hypothetical protein
MIIPRLLNGLHKHIACRHCHLIFARKQDLFNVTGAEGLSGVYVNRYG